MDRIIDILMQRDDMTRAEAQKLLDITMDEIYQALEEQDYELVEDIWTGNIGLEPDYLFEEMI